MSFFGLNFGGGAEIDIILDDADSRKMADVKDENGRKERFYLFYDGESVTGKVNVTLHRKTSKLEHQGIKIELIGHIELYYDRGNHHEFLSLTKELAGPGDITQNKTFDFEFNQVEKPFETYTGVNVRLRYFLRVTMGRRLTDQTKELTLAVHTLATYPDMNNPIKMEVGIEECLHIEFEYNKSKYHLKDVIVGKIYFLLVRIKIKHMEIAIIKREATGAGPNTYHESENIAKYEIMDGAPVRGESIPIRVFLAGYDLTPPFRDVIKKFSVRYYLNLVLVDEEDRRYFKQQEIVLWRKGERVRKLPLSTSLYQQQQHALARHQAGDMPTQGIRTAPTPSLPPTPSIGESESRLPGDGCQADHQSQEIEAMEQSREDTEEEELADSAHQVNKEPPVNSEQPPNTTQQTYNNNNQHQAPPDLVSGTQDLNLNETSDARDAKNDLDVVASRKTEPVANNNQGSPGGPITADRDSDGTSGGDTRPFSPPDITDDIEDGDVDLVAGEGDVIDLDLPDAPTSEPGSPQAKEDKRLGGSSVGGQLTQESV